MLSLAASKYFRPAVHCWWRLGGGSNVQQDGAPRLDASSSSIFAEAFDSKPQKAPNRSETALRRNISVLIVQRIGSFPEKTRSQLFSKIFHHPYPTEKPSLTRQTTHRTRIPTPDFLTPHATFQSGSGFTS